MVNATVEVAPNARWQNRREHILDVAAKIFSSKGYHRTTTREIGEQVGMLSGSLYYYFDSKETMVEAVMARYWVAMFAEFDRVEASSAGAAERFVDLYVSMVRVSIQFREQVTILHQDWHSLYEIDPAIEKKMRRTEVAWMKVLNDGVATGEFTHDVEPWSVFRTLLGAVSWVPRWYRADGEFTVEQVGLAQAQIILRGIQTF